MIKEILQDADLMHFLNCLICGPDFDDTERSRRYRQKFWTTLYIFLKKKQWDMNIIW